MKDIKRIDNRLWHVKLSRWGLWMWNRFCRSGRTSKSFYEWCNENPRTTTCYYVRGLFYSLLMPIIWFVPLLYAFYVFFWLPYRSLGSDIYTNIVVTAGTGVGGVGAMVAGIVVLLYVGAFLSNLYEKYLAKRTKRFIRSTTNGISSVSSHICRRSYRESETPPSATTVTVERNRGEKVSVFRILAQRIKDRHDRMCSIIEFEDPHTLGEINNPNLDRG